VKASKTVTSAKDGLVRLAERYRLNDRQRSQFETILAVLEADERSPTAVRDPDRAVDAHLADSLVALELGVLRDARRIADLGAGAGFPGAPLAIVLPAARVWLVEAQARKCVFIEALCAKAGIANASIVCARAEEWAAGMASNDVVLARAVAQVAVVLEYAAPLMRVGGTLIDWRGRRDADAERAGLVAARRLGLERTEIRRVEPYEGARDHHLHVYVKQRATPSGFPRRAGIARKRPLAG
jgi:16S rRNA (guanine527-N7)-methyltransferase